MVKIKKAKHSGFCFGVKRAINMAQDALEDGGRIYSLGPIIHNPLVVEDLNKKGIRVVSGIPKKRDGRILRRTQGIPPSIRGKLVKGKRDIIDATCPFVDRLHKIVNNLKKEGLYVIIVGEAKHPEIVALTEASGENTSVIIGAKEVAGLKLNNKPR